MNKPHHQMKSTYSQLSLLDLLKKFILSRLPQEKSAMEQKVVENEAPISPDQITHIAVVLDGVVEDVMRAQNRFAALILSNPEFVEFDPHVEIPRIGETKYVDGKFEHHSHDNELMSDEEVAKTLDKLGIVKNNEDQ